jgi:hypothetical protein
MVLAADLGDLAILAMLPPLQEEAARLDPFHQLGKGFLDLGADFAG